MANHVAHILCLKCRVAGANEIALAAVRADKGLGYHQPVDQVGCQGLIGIGAFKRQQAEGL